LKPGRSTTVLVVLALTNLVSYAARNGLFAVYPTLKAKFDIDDSQIGLLTTVFMLPHAAATLPFGWAGDRFDRRRVIVVGIAIASLAGGLGAFAVDWYSLAASRALVGLGTAAVVPVANSILGQIFDGPHKASRISIFNLGLFLGGVVGFFTGSIFGFPAVVLILAVPGLALAATLGALPVPERPVREHGRLRDFMVQLIADARALLPIRTLRWLLLSATAMAFAAGGFTAWLNEFLIRRIDDGGKGMAPEAATRLLVLALCGGLAGILVGGRVADHLGARYANGRLWTIVIGMSCTAPCAALAIVLPAGPALVAIGIATMFFISWYHAPIAASVDDLAPPSRSVAAQGLVIFTMHMIGTAPSSYVVGVISQHSSLYHAMWVPTGGLVVAALCMATATTSFAADRARARSGGGAGASL
jgi:MFS family permease